MIASLRIGWLAGMMLISLAATAAPAPIGISVGVTVRPAGAIDPDQIDAGGAAAVPIALSEVSDLTHVSPASDLTQAAWRYDPFRALSVITPSGPLRQGGFYLRPIAEPDLTTTISQDGTLSISSGGEDLLGRGLTRFGTGEARRLPGLHRSSSFSVLMQFEPSDGFLSGPFVSDATFTALYSALDQDRRPRADTNVNVARHASFP